MDPDLIRSVLTQFEDNGKFPTSFMPTGVNTEDLPALLEQLEQAGLLVLYKEGQGESGASAVLTSPSTAPGPTAARAAGGSTTAPVSSWRTGRFEARRLARA